MEVGEQVTILTKGDIVSSESHIVCGTCFQCTNGQSHLCQEISLIGVDRPGGFAQFVVIPAKNAIKCQGLPLEIAFYGRIWECGGYSNDRRAFCKIGSNYWLWSSRIDGHCSLQLRLGAKQIIATGFHKNE